MSSSTIYRLSGVSLIIGGLLAAVGVVGQGFFPDILSSPWLLVSLLVYIGLFFVLFGLPAVYARQMKRAGIFGLISFVLFFLACLQFGGSGGMTDIVLLPWIMKIAPGGLNNPPLSFILFFLFAKLLIFVSSVVFGIATLRAGILPKGSVVLLLVGTVLFIFGGKVHVIPHLDYFGEMLFFLSFVWFGSALLSQPRQIQEFQLTSTPAGTESRT